MYYLENERCLETSPRNLLLLAEWPWFICKLHLGPESSSPPQRWSLLINSRSILCPETLPVKMFCLCSCSFFCCRNRSTATIVGLRCPEGIKANSMLTLPPAKRAEVCPEYACCQEVCNSTDLEWNPSASEKALWEGPDLSRPSALSNDLLMDSPGVNFHFE